MFQEEGVQGLQNLRIFLEYCQMRGPVIGGKDTLDVDKVTNITMTARILELRIAKKFIREIASEVGVSRGTVSNVLKVA